jgi:hypothetical protein
MELRMHTSLRTSLMLALLASPLVGCGRSPDPAPVAPPSGADPGAAKAAAVTEQKAATVAPVFAEDAPGIALDAVPGMQVRRDFSRSYLALDSWKLFAEPDSKGMPLAALVLEGSNEVTAAELRLGRSDDADAVKRCLDLPAEATGKADTVQIGGVPFTHFSAGDAAMSHYVSAESYRAVQDGRCYAIDLVVAGTRPEVYDPPKVPPFSNEEAKEKLAAALKAVRWLR